MPDEAGHNVSPASERTRAPKRRLTTRAPQTSRTQTTPAKKSHRVLLLSLAVVVALLLIFYAPVKALYSAHRNAQLYQAQLDALAASNASLQEKAERLESRAGIEDEARKRGYVYEGETAVSVEGATTDASSEAQSDASASTLDDITTQDPWYIKVLDKVFAYEPSSYVG